jgi:CheY-like chemotaxis protein
VLGESIRVVVDLEEDLWSISGDAVSIDQVVTNLAINGRDAMPDGGTLVIETSNLVLEHDGSQMSQRARSGRFVRISVADSGSGMDEDTQARVFDPFFSTKNSSEHSGLGLSIVYGTVSGHNGWVDLESAPGKGTRFDVFLPALDEASAADSARIASPPIVEGSGQRILVLEDETVLRDTLRNILERMGYAVECCADLTTARSAIAETRFDLILSDMRLPDGKGTTLITEALERNPSTATILMSGYASTPEDRARLELVTTSFLAKPFELADLLSEVRGKLDRSR